MRWPRKLHQLIRFLYMPVSYWLRAGFNYGSDFCDDVNECDDGNNGACAQLCFNSAGGYSCGCEEGYELGANSVSCYDVDECGADTDGCDPVTQWCENTAGSFTCTDCPQGYAAVFGGLACSDVYECENNNGGCLQLCRNTVGGHDCACNVGFELAADERSCDVVIGCHCFQY